MRQPIQVGIVVARQRGLEWEYLMLRRVKQGGGFWQYVTGGVEDEESPLEAAIRELREETGFVVETLEAIDYARSFPVPESMKHHYDYGVTELIEHSFLAKVASDSEPGIDPIEHEEYRWCTAEEASRLLYWPSNKEVLKISVAILRD